MSCSCDTYEIVVDGDRLTGVRELDPECSVHSYPGDEWRAGSPLRRHARYVDRETGEVFTTEEAVAVSSRVGKSLIEGGVFWGRFRLESPREVTARLLEEAR